MQPRRADAPAHDAFTRLLHRLEPDPATLWHEVEPQVERRRGVLVVDGSTLDKPYAKKMALVHRHWSGKHYRVVDGINLITLLWTDGDDYVPCDWRVFDKPNDLAMDRVTRLEYAGMRWGIAACHRALKQECHAEHAMIRAGRAQRNHPTHKWVPGHGDPGVCALGVAPDTHERELGMGKAQHLPLGNAGLSLPSPLYPPNCVSPKPT